MTDLEKLKRALALWRLAAAEVMAAIPCDGLGGAEQGMILYLATQTDVISAGLLEREPLASAGVSSN